MFYILFGGVLQQIVDNMLLCFLCVMPRLLSCFVGCIRVQSGSAELPVNAKLLAMGLGGYSLWQSRAQGCHEPRKFKKSERILASRGGVLPSQGLAFCSTAAA